MMFAEIFVLLSAAQIAGTYAANHYALSTADPAKEVVVQLFEWKWKDVANECENFLSKYGYGAVQVSPAAEHITSGGSSNIPWWIKYQPIGYKICTRSGDEQEFKDMVRRCNKAGIRIIVDVVTNHMAGEGSVNTGWCGTAYDSRDHQENFPGVPYNKTHFNDDNCDHDITDYNDAWNVRKCRLVSLADLNQDKQYTREAIAKYLDKLVSFGVAGFRVDAAKHQYPKHLQDIFDRLSGLNTTYFPPITRPFVAQELIDMKSGEAIRADDYLGVGRVTNFLYGSHISNAVKRWNNFKWFGNFGEAWGMWNGDTVLVFIDNHDNQRDNGGNHPLTYKDSYSYTMASTFMLAWPYGLPRVMSSYYFDNNDQGPPCCSEGNRVTAPYFNPDETCDSKSGWVCEHRWPEIRRMTMFRSVTYGEPVKNVMTDEHRLAFSRGGKGFFAVNNDPTWRWDIHAQTGLPAGSYCDIISGEPTDTGCSGTVVTVDANGMSQIRVPAGKTFAIHVGAKRGSAGTTKAPTPRPLLTPTPSAETASTQTPKGMQKTVIYLQKPTGFGQSVYLRGGDENGNSIPIRIVAKDVPKNCAIDDPNEANKDHILSWKPKPSLNLPGVPMYYTTNDANNPCYESANVAKDLGRAFWKAEIEMDCSKLTSNWFELKGYMNGWESNVSQASTCAGTAKAARPALPTINHRALCGSVNVFQWDEGNCRIDVN